MKDDGAGEVVECGKRVVVGRASMDHDRLAKLGGEFELGGEEAALCVVRSVVPVPVEPGLAHRHRLGVLEKVAQRGEIVRRGRPRLVRVDAEDREHAFVPLGE